MSEGYYVSTVGLNEATIKKYIQDQEKAEDNTGADDAELLKMVCEVNRNRNHSIPDSA